MCIPTDDGLIGRMYVAELSEMAISTCSVKSLLPVTQRSLSFPNYTISKNWLAFTHSVSGSDEDEKLYFIHQISPRFIIMIADIISTDEISTSIAYNTSTPSFIVDLDVLATTKEKNISGEYRFEDELNDVGSFLPEKEVFPSTNRTFMRFNSSIHGNVNPVRVAASQSSFGFSYYLSIFHLVSPHSDLNYASYAFTFCETIPFHINSISPKLSLETEMWDRSHLCNNSFAFVSGLSIDNCDSSTPFSSQDLCVYISYGVCDLESRLSIVRFEEFERKFYLFSNCSSSLL